MTYNSNNDMWFQEMDRTNPLDTPKSEERPEGSLNADTLAEVQVDNSLNTEQRWEARAQRWQIKAQRWQICSTWRVPHAQRS